MAKPILLSIDDDADVLRAIERDLRTHYGASYRVLASDGPEQALDLLKQLKVRNDSVALLLVDQRMPKMDGVAFLREAMQTPSALCSPHMPIPAPPSAPSMKPTSIFSF
jgi:thioredoxin reductase (NADPH)